MLSRTLKTARTGVGADCAKPARGLETAVNAVAVCVAVAVALISLGYTFLAYPQADDLERTAAMRTFSPLERVQSDYLRIDGRWASLFVQYLCYRGGHTLERYPAMLLVLLITGLIGCCCAVAIVTGRRISERPVLAGGVIAYAFLWLSAPWGEAFYWFPGGMGYWLPVALGMVLLWVFCSFAGWWSRIVVVGMSFVVPAFHEVCGGWVVGVLGVTCLVRIARARAGVGTAASAALAGVLGTASVVLAPGVWARADHSPYQSPFDALNQALRIYASLASHWIATVPVLIAILLAAARMQPRPAWYEEAPLFIKACLAAAIVPLPILLFTAISYGLGGNIPARLNDGVYFMLAAGVATFVAACGFDLGRWAAIKAFLDTQWGSLLRGTVVILALVGVMHVPRFHAAFRDIQPAIRNRAWLDVRAAEILADRDAGIRDVVVSQRMTPLTILPTYMDLTEDPNWFLNRHMAKYFGVRSIRLSAPLPAKGGGGIK